MQESLLVLLVFTGCALVAIAFSPIGGAIASRIRRGGAQGPDLPAEVEELRARLAEVEERLDFAERAVTSGPAARPPLLDAPT